MMEDPNLAAIQDAGWHMSAAGWDAMSQASRDFCILEMTGERTYARYCQRLRAIGFEGHATVLDAGTGIGQWAMALASMNEKVVAVDRSQERVDASRAFICESGRSENVHVLRARVGDLPIASGSIDAAFCYGVIMFTDVRATLMEFARVLKPGGVLYVNANDVGWYVYMLLHRGLMRGRWSQIKAAGEFALNSLSGKSSRVVVGKSYMGRALRDAHFSLVGCAAEGGMAISDHHLDGDIRFYRPTYLGLPMINEYLARREK